MIILPVDDLPLNVERAQRRIVGQLVPRANAEVNVARAAARAGVGHRHGQLVAQAADAVVAARVLGPDLLAAVGFAVGDGGDQVRVGVHLAAGAGDAVLVVGGAAAGGAVYN